MGYDSWDVKPYRDHRSDAPISVYLITGKGKAMDKISCIWCKRTIYDVKGTIDKIITMPMPVEEFDIAINILCKLCHSNYRLLINAS